MTRSFHTAGRSLLALAVLTALTTSLLAAEKNVRKATGKPDAVSLTGFVDQEIAKGLGTTKPAALADDSEFLRRAYLDITGVIPPADKVREFLDGKDANKRAKLIDELLASPNYGRHMADMWQAMLLPKTSDTRRLDNTPFVKWMEEQFNANTPWDKLTTELLNCAGPMDKNPGVAFFLTNATADKVTDQVSRLFMGVQLQCAQCHNHPFTSYKQDDYWGMAAYFTKVRVDKVNAAVKNGTSPSISEDPKARGQKGLPESAKALPPKPLHDTASKVKDGDPLRPVFVAWLTSPENKFFARAMVNRVWYQMFGRGIVNPVDDMTAEQTPSHPELLNRLADEFTASGYDVKFLVRAVANSQAYQRTAKVTPGTDDLSEKFGRMAVKVLTPEQLFDSLETVVGKAGNQSKADLRATADKRLPGNTARSQFVAFFGVGDEHDPTEYQAGIPQALRLMNSREMNGALAVLGQVKTENAAAAVEQIYLATLARRPTADETAKMTAFVAKSGDARRAYSDIVWAVLNSSEFALCH